MVPTSATITLYTPSGGTLQEETACSVDSTTGEMTYSLTATHTTDHDLNYKALWCYLYKGTYYYQSQLFDVVKSILSIPITDDDLYLELESLAGENEQQTGTATSATSSTLVDTLNRKETDSYWKGGKLEIISGTGDGQIRDITAFTQSTATITVTPDFTTTPDNTSVYKVTRSYASRIEQAFEDLETRIYNKGSRHELILESSQIKYPLLFLTIHKICQDLSDQEGDKWDRIAGKYYEKFDNAFDTMKVEYDEDESGQIDATDEESQSRNTMRIYRA